MYTSVNNSIPAITANSSARCQRNINNDHNCNNVNTYPTKFRTLAYSFQKQYAAANINSIAISSTQLPNHIITSPETPQTADTSIKRHLPQIVCHKSARFGYRFSHKLSFQVSQSHHANGQYQHICKHSCPQ